MKPANFESHVLFEKLNQLNLRLIETEVKEKIDLETLAFYESVFQYISDRIKLTIPLLVQETEMNAIGSEIDAALQQINSYIGNSNAGHLTNATNNFTSALNRIKNFPLIFAKGDFNFSKSVATFEKLLSEKYESVENKNKLLDTEIQTFQKDLETKENEIQRLFKLVEDKENEIQNLNTSFQNEFTLLKTKANQEIEADRKTFRIEFDADKQLLSKELEDLKKDIDRDTSSLIENLELKLKDAEKIVNVIGNIGVTGNYKLIANEHKSSANLWRIIAILFMVIFSVLLIITIIDLSSQEFNWTRSLLRIIAAAALSYPATYAAKESSKHRHLETINRTAELELASINPFIETLSDDKKQAIKEKLVEKYFGNDKSTKNESGSNQEEISIAGFEKILKAVSVLNK